MMNGFFASSKTTIEWDDRMKAKTSFDLPNFYSIVTVKYASLFDKDSYTSRIFTIRNVKPIANMTSMEAIENHHAHR